MDWDRPLAASIDRLYQSGTILKSTVYACVGDGMISEEDYKKITGDDYTVA